MDREDYQGQLGLRELMPRLPHTMVESSLPISLGNRIRKLNQSAEWGDVSLRLQGLFCTMLYDQAALLGPHEPPRREGGASRLGS
jgi:hypothetical protein